jgi:hypothetical protein
VALVPGQPSVLVPCCVSENGLHFVPLALHQCRGHGAIISGTTEYPVELLVGCMARDAGEHLFGWWGGSVANYYVGTKHSRQYKSTSALNTM